MKITIIGLGLIGGSMALSLRRAKFGSQFIGVEANEAHASQALALGLVDQILPLEEAVAQSQLVILSVPVDKAARLIAHVLDLLPPQAVLSDVGSTKGSACEATAGHAKRGRFVASHPIAGTENTGPGAAFDGLFKGKMNIICEEEKSDADAVALVEQMYSALEMQLIYMDAEEHDKHIAYVSHLSHLTSFTLGLTVLEVEKSEKNIFQLAGSGFASTARLAKSSPQMWVPIFLENKENMLHVVDEYLQQLMQFRQAIAQADADALRQMMLKANEIRRILGQ
jgi:prephenate dehydrogenase